jgi:outer membrane receptor protein involved in Fe transport
MNSKAYGLLIGCSLVALVVPRNSALFAQTAPAPSVASANAGEETVKLDPFNVSADSDVGFVAATSLAGGRIATALKDTPVAYSVITREFIDAFNITDVVQAAEWTPSGGNNMADNAGTGGGATPSAALTMRGVRTGAPQRNYFSFMATPDSYSIDRIDFGRGPNAVLYGTGGQAGTQNSITKQALLARTIRDVAVRIGSYGRFRLTADLNQPVTDKLAFRVNLMTDQGHTWKESEYNRKKGVQLASTWQLTPKLTIRGDLEFMKAEALVMTNMKDQTSAWDGRSTYPSTLPLSGAGVPTTAMLAPQGLVRLTVNRFAIYPDPAWEGMALNFNREYRTKGAQHNNNATLTNWLNGKPIRTVGYSLHNQAVNDLQGTDPTVRWANALAGSPHFHIPLRHENALWDNYYPTWNEQDLSQTLLFNYRLNDNFFVELAGNINRSYVIGRQTNRRGLNEQRIDVARVLPNGAPNPYFLRTYSENMDYDNDRKNTFQNLRFQAVYTNNSRFGKLQLATLAGMTNHLTLSRGSSPLLPLTSLAPDARTWVDNLELSEYGLYSRTYLDFPRPDYWPKTHKLKPVRVFNPITGVNEVVTPKWTYDTRREDNNTNATRKYKFLQFAGNLDLFKNRLVLIGAFRRDFASLSSNRVLQPGSYQPGWDGTTIEFRKGPPADYWEMMYTPKNAAGVPIGPPESAVVRPRINVANAQVPAPQYANDRFRDDFDAPTVSPIVNTVTYGAVLNVTRTIGLYANFGDNYEIVQPFERLDGSLVLPTAAEGKDAGVRFTLPNGRLSVSVGWFSSFQDGNLVDIPISGPYNTIAATPIVGDLSSTGQNIRGARRFPQTVIKDTNTTTTEGYEFDLTANLTSSWRVIMNAGKITTKLTKQYPDSVKYFATQDATTRQILQDAGIMIDANNNAFINPALDDPTKINQTKVQAAVDAWNTLQDTTIPSITGRKDQVGGGSVPYTANFATDYRFRGGPMRGLRLGVGVNYRSGMVVGNRTNQTIPDPNNPNVAIDDPAVDEATPVYGNANYKVTGTVSYTYRFAESAHKLAPKTVTFDLFVDNLFNNREANYVFSSSSATTSYTVNAPYNGDYTSPARIVVPGTPVYFNPRNFLLTARLSF